MNGCPYAVMQLDWQAKAISGGKKKEMETGRERWRHRLLCVGQSEAPFTWQPGLTRHRQSCLASESWQSIFEPWSDLCFFGRSDRGRPVSWLTDPSRRVLRGRVKRAIRSPRLLSSFPQATCF